MALSSFTRVVNIEVKRCGFILSSRPTLSIIPSANITSKEWRDPDVKKPAPWPYKTKKYTYIRSLFDTTVKRFDENTKIIVVDGNIGIGKGKFAKELAEAFDFHYVPEPTTERFYLSPYGYDLRQLNPIAPPSYKVCDLETFYKNPKHRNVAMFQFQQYMCRYEEYIDALGHLLSTGQGVVMERSAYSDFVFLEAMHKHGYIRKEAVDFYYEILDHTLEELLRPHLIIYLDVPPDIVMQRIKERNNPIEVNSPVLTKEYIESIDYFYKQSFLKEFQKHSELLIYDWSNSGDVEVVVEDIEKIDFDKYDDYTPQLSDWRRKNDWKWSYLRYRYINDKPLLLQYSVIPRFRVKEVWHPMEEVKEWKKIMAKVPGEQYSDGFNPSAGDNVWFKTKNKSYYYGSRMRSPGVYE